MSNSNVRPYFIFDVESIGLHGEGFAVGWIVVDIENGKELESHVLSINPDKAQGSNEDRQWVKKNIPQIRSELPIESTKELRRIFCEQWIRWKDQGAALFAECLWPVEANFLSAGFRENPVLTKGNEPYPFYDVASIMMAAGMNPLETYDRIDGELPKHHPLSDAKQSYRLLIQALNIVKRDKTVLYMHGL